MSNVRTNQGHVSPEHAARIAKQESNRKHFENTVIGSIKQSLPLRALESDASDANALMAHLPDGNGKPKGGYVDYITDFTDYEGFGFNSEVEQVIRFDNDDPGAKATFRYLGVADGPDTGLVYDTALDERGKAIWEKNVVQHAAEPIGRWTLKRSPVNEAQVPRHKDHFYCEVNGEQMEIPKGKVFNIGTDGMYAFLADINVALSMDPNEKVSVVVEPETWIEESQVLHLEDGDTMRHFAYRNFLGMLEFNNGQSRAEWPLCDTDPKTIARNRKTYDVSIGYWMKMSSNDRETYRFSKDWRTPKHRGEAYLVRKQCLLNRQDNFFVEVVKNDNGKWVPRS